MHSTPFLPRPITLVRNLATPWALALCLTVSVVGSVSAQGTADPNVAAQRGATDLTPDPSRPLGVLDARPDGARSPVSSPALDGRPRDDDATTIQVDHIVVKGVTALDGTTLKGFTHRYEGKQVTLGQLRKLTVRIGKALRQRGYFLARVTIPAQDVTKGTVILVASEGRYGRVVVEGEEHYTEGFVRRFFSPALRGGPVQLGALERALLVLNEFPDLKVRASFRPGARSGETDVLLRVSDHRPVHVGFDYNNFGNRLVGQNRVGVSLWAGSAIAEGDEFFFRVVEPFPTESKPIFQGGYALPVGDRGMRLAVNASSARVRVGRDLAPLDIRGEADVYSLVLQRPVERRLTRANDFQFGFTSKSVKNFVFGTIPTSQDELRLFTFGYSGNHVYPDGSFVFSLLMTQGLGTGFGGSLNGGVFGQLRTSRPEAGNGLTKLNVDVTRSYRMGRRGLLVGRGGLQYSVRPLVTAEQFAAGGPDSVRGYIPGESLGDDGYLASLEYRHQLLRPAQGDGLRISGVLFLDQGGTGLNAPLPGERGSQDLTGAGIGLRASVGRGTTARLDLGIPVSEGKNVQGDSSVLYGQLATRF